MQGDVPRGETPEALPHRTGSALEVFGAFLKLGVTSFGGPIAHLGYFRDELVVRRRWVEEDTYADLVALCQFLPGPASSQVGFALGLRRAGALGALAAWTAFTLPSALLMFAFAYAADLFAGQAGQAAIHGLKLVAVAIVAHAVWGMALSLTPDRPRIAVALLAIFIVVLAGGAFGQIAAILMGGILGLWLCRGAMPGQVGQLRSRMLARVAAVALVADSKRGSPSLGIRLLADLRAVFGGDDHLATEDILHSLREIEESPWGDLRGKPLDARGLAQRLRPYEIKPTTVRIGDSTPKGYRREDLHDPWLRYLGPPRHESATSATCATDAPVGAELHALPQRAPDGSLPVIGECADELMPGWGE